MSNNSPPLSQAPLLQVRNLKTWFQTTDRNVRAVDGINITINKGETFALLGESGCGKSMTSLSIMRLLPEPAGRVVSGKVNLYGEDLLQLPEIQMRNIRGDRIAMIFQEPMTSLNPVMSVGQQIQEAVVHHKKKDKSEAKKRSIELLDSVGIPDAKQRFEEFPHQLSGGMKQRVMIAMALAGEPELLIADEPTTALDVTIQSQVLDLLRRIQKDNQMAIMLITHDLGVVAEMADRIAVMYAGQIVETADRDRFFSDPQHPYSKKLFESLPNINKRDQRLAVIKGAVPSLDSDFKGCRFEQRCEYVQEICRQVPPKWVSTGEQQGALCHLMVKEGFTIDDAATQQIDVVYIPSFHKKGEHINVSDTNEKQAEQKISGSERQIGENKQTKYEGSLLNVKQLKVHFPVQKGLFKRTVGYVKAVDDISLTIEKGKTLALVGESGCGKTTVGKGILQLIKPTAGGVLLNEFDLTKLSKQELRARRADIQIIFQDPYSSMNPRMMINDIIEEGMIAQNIEIDRIKRQTIIDRLLEQVGLSMEVKHRYPHEFSGGQRQRICIARALAVNPKLIICDEPTSALDVSVQAQILNLLKQLQDDLGISYLFITHDLSVVEYLADDVAVMYLGRIVEQGSVKEVVSDPQHPYTKALLSAVPSTDLENKRQTIHLKGELPSPMRPPNGCHFNPRCNKVMQICRNDYPKPIEMSDSHKVRCFLFDKDLDSLLY